MSLPLELSTAVAADGFRLAVQVSGDRQAGPLLLLPGQANSHGWWSGLRGAFERHHRVITFDYRGTGASRGPIGQWTTAGFADDAAAVLAALRVGRAHVYATSMGGRVAQELAIDHDLVDRLVLACTSPGGSVAVERSDQIRRRLADRDDARRRAELVRLFYTDAWGRRPEQSTLLGDPTMTGAEKVAHLRVSAGHDAADRLARIGAPTLVLHGAADEMVPAVNAQLIADRIPGATLHVHPTGRHGFFDEFAGEITPVVQAFLQAVSPEACRRRGAGVSG